MRAKTMTLLMLAWLLAPSILATGTIEKVALTGDPTPSGIPYYLFFGGPPLSNNGQIAFVATVGPGPFETALYRGDTLAVQRIATWNEPEPGGNGTIQSLACAIGPSGGLGCSALLQGTSGGSTDNSAIYFWGPGAAPVDIVMREGQAEPEGDGLWGGNNSASLLVVAGGVVGFRTQLTGTSGGNANDRGLYLWDAGQITRIVRDGQSLPGGLTSADPDWFYLNDSGDAAFSGRMTMSPDTAHHTRVNTLLTRIVRENDDIGDGRLSDLVNAGSLPVYNNDGAVAFKSVLTATSGGTSTNEAVFLHTLGGLTEVARKGQTIPGGGTTLGSTGEVLLAMDDTVVFLNTLANSDVGLFVARPGSSLASVIVTGDPSPDGDGTLQPFGFALNAGVTASGSVAAKVNLAGSSDPAFDGHAMVLGDEQQLLLIARPGDPLEGSTISYVDFAGGPAPSRNGVNDHGQVAFRAVLVDGRSGIFLYTPVLHRRPGVGGAWNAPGGWTAGLQPALPHEVYVDPVGPLTVVGPSTPTIVAALSVGSSSGGRTDLTLTGGGSLTVNGTLTVTSAGGLSGSDPLTADVVNGGLVSPGASPGILSVTGNYTQQPAGELMIEIEGLIAGMEHDRLSVTQSAQLDGLLQVSLGGGYTPVAGDSFDVLRADTIVGTFASENLPALPGGLEWAVDYDLGPGIDTVRLSVVSSAGGPGSVPDGRLVAGTLLTVNRASGIDLALAWGASCNSGDDYEVYEGLIGDFTSHQPVTCSTGGVTSATITPSLGSRYYLIVPHNSGMEGSYGYDGGPAERPASTGACRPQQLETCS